MSSPSASLPHTRRVLFQSRSARVVDFRCTADVEGVGEEEPNAAHAIVFVRRGSFQRIHRGETLTADANSALFFNAAEPYRYAHPIPGGDECTILALEPALATELVALSARGAHAPRTPAARRRRHELAEAVKVALNRNLGSPPGLEELSRAFGCSPYHLSRAFHAEVGLPLRRYFSRLRASAAADRLAAGEEDLTGIALDLGYADHSHFTNAFRQVWGIPPSRFRERLRRISRPGAPGTPRRPDRGDARGSP